jgi:osmotically-inducible protein OsmY
MCVHGKQQPVDGKQEPLESKAKAEAEARLRASAELAEHPIPCEFREGVLTLRGRVPTYSLKQAAWSLVQRIHGVRAVDNQIDVIPVPISDGPGNDRRTVRVEDYYRTD